MHGKAPSLKQYRLDEAKIMDEFDIVPVGPLRDTEAQVLLVFLKDWWQTI